MSKSYPLEKEGGARGGGSGGGNCLCNKDIFILLPDNYIFGLGSVTQGTGEGFQGGGGLQGLEHLRVFPLGLRSLQKQYKTKSC